MPLLLLLFVVVPAVELWLLIEVGSQIGVGNTILLILVTGILGASLARSQGLAVLARVQREMEAGRAPTAGLLEGALILVAGGVLLTPGFLTDVVGLLLLIPFTRRLFLGAARRAFAAAARRGGGRATFTSVHFGGRSESGGPDDGPGGGPPGDAPRPFGGGFGSPPVKDVEFEVHEKSREDSRKDGQEDRRDPDSPPRALE